MSIPVTLVTGFLGAGKSTFINRLMKEYPERRFGIVVNEFGDVRLESQIVDAAEDAITELPNGCMCCVVRSDLVGSIEGLLKKNPSLDHIILEASGLSDPVPIAVTFLEDNLGGRIRFDSIICVVDALQFLDSIDDYLIAAQQVSFADFVLLSKVEEAGPAIIERTRATVRALRPNSRILELRADTSLELLIDVTDVDHSSIEGLELEEHHHHEHDHDDAVHEEEDSDATALPEGKRPYRHAHEKVDTYFYKSETPFDMKAFRRFVHRLPATVIRAKGFVHFGDPEMTDTKYVLQLVGNRPVLEERRWRRGEHRQNALVFIGRGFDSSELRHNLESCAIWDLDSALSPEAAPPATSDRS